MKERPILNGGGHDLDAKALARIAVPGPIRRTRGTDLKGERRTRWTADVGLEETPGGRGDSHVESPGYVGSAGDYIALIYVEPNAATC